LKLWQWGGLGLKTDQSTREQEGKGQYQPQLLQAYSEHYIVQGTATHHDEIDLMLEDFCRLIMKSTDPSMLNEVYTWTMHATDTVFE
jgi:hypothetical protein